MHKQVVNVLLFKDPCGGDPLEYLQLEERNGVWSALGPKSWEGCYYVYEVVVYHPSTSQVETCIVNDPYARGYEFLCTNIQMMQMHMHVFSCAMSGLVWMEHDINKHTYVIA